jgi:HlyD family secretion protein
VKKEYSLSDKMEQVKAERDAQIREVFCGTSDKFILVIGPCSADYSEPVLEYISPKGVEENGANLFEIKAAVNAPDSVVIRSGYSANAEIVLERLKQTLAVPEGSVEFSGDSTFVYLLTTEQPQQFRRQQIEVGMSDGIKIAVKGGITANDRIRGNKVSD